MNSFSKAIVASGLLLLGSCDNTNTSKSTIMLQDARDSLFTTINPRQQIIQMKVQEQQHLKIDMAFSGHFVNQEPESLLATIKENNDRESAAYIANKYRHLPRRKKEILATITSIAVKLRDYNKVIEILQKLGSELNSEQKAELDKFLKEANLTFSKE